MIALGAREAYPHWAATYDRETVVSAIENRLIGELGVITRDKRLLDVACGTGRRLRESAARLAVGIDLSPEMLRAGGGGEWPAVAADARALPFAPASFDVVWCRLVIGHLPHIAPLFAELARVCVESGRVLVSDLTPSAFAAGHRRTFRDDRNELIEVEHHLHDIDEQRDAASHAGLRLESLRIGVVDERVRSYYVDANVVAKYEDQRGQELVHALVFERV
jgi:malonyl-CoA O-methyltransferase